MLRLGTVLVSLAVFSAAPLLSQTAPNIVVIFTDDQGFGDVGCFGAKDIATPHLDQLAKEGRKFTNFYVAQPVCGASRAALLTGCYPNRIGIHGAPGPGSKTGISASEMTIAELVKQKLYATAIFGKWHLGHHRQFLPLQHGFDEWYGLPYSNDMWPHHPQTPKAYPPLPLFEGNKVINPRVTAEDQGRMTQDLTRRAVSFIERNRERPFFLYLAHPMPHVPLFGAQSFRGRSKRGRFGDIIEEIDHSVGQVLHALKRTGVSDNTWVIFTSDNGPWISYGDHAGTTAGLREAKGTTWEGGVRVPCIMKWPGKIPANTTCDTPLMTIDLLPTIAARINASLPDHPIDGKDVWPLISSNESQTSPHRAYFFYYHRNELQGLRSGKWSLKLPHRYRTLGEREGGKNGQPVRYSYVNAKESLFDLDEDPFQTTDLAAEHPAVVQRLRALAEAAREEFGDSRTKQKGTGVRQPGRLKQ